MKQPMLSVVLATHNEAKNLAKCLDSVKSLADEIIVVDGESTDETVTIAKKYKAKVIATTNKANFHINKQMAMDAARGNLVLQLDADEVVDDELADFIRHVETELTTPDQPVAWWLKRRNFFLGRFLKKGGQYPDPVIRLYIKGKARLPQKDVHEQMVADGPVGWADGHLLHYSYPTFNDYIRKFQTYTTFKAHQLKEAGVKPGFWPSFKFVWILPVTTFGWLFFRHKGFVDGVPGFVFALFSGLHHAVAYLKCCELYQSKEAP